MANTYDNLDVADLLKSQLENRLRDEISDKLTHQFLEELKPQIKEIVQNTVNHVTINDIDHFRNLMKLRDELYVELGWNGQETKAIKEFM